MRERRIVSILFSDLSGFTRLSERMDPEDVADTIDALFHRFRAAIESLGGTVDKFIGDAVMAVFGAPVAHADDPARAVRAGLALQRELVSFNRERGLELAMRVGVNTGEVLWGSVGGSAATAMGDAVNVAQRLEGAAPRGAVLVSSATHDGAARLFRYEPRGEVTLKGREGVVQTFEVIEELTGQTEHVEGARGTALVGREAELEDLVRRVGAATGAFLVLEGSAGVGKSRLLAEMRARVRRSGRRAWVAVGRAYEGVRAPLGPMAEVVRAETGVSGSSPGEALRFAAALAAGLEALDTSAVEREDTAALIALSIGIQVPDSRTGKLEPARAADEIAGAWVQWLRARALRGPVLLCLEDLHWADAGTLALLAQLAVRLARMPVVIIATRRPGPAIPVGFERIALGDLGHDASERLALSLLGSRGTTVLARQVIERAGGHPYFIEELARAILSHPAGLDAKSLPDSLLGLLVSRLDEQPTAVREALKAASAFGRAFWPALVAETAGVEVSGSFEEALRRELLMVQPSSLVPGERQLAFRHALLRDAAYSLLPRKDRQRLHTAGAAALEARAPTGGRRLRAMSAEQLRLAGDEAGAASRWESAAVEADEARAVGEVAEYALAALSLRFTRPAALAGARALSAFTRYAEALEVCARALAQPGLSPGERVAFEFLAAGAEQGQGRSAEALLRMSAVDTAPLTPVDRLRVVMVRLSNHQLLNCWAEIDKGLPVAEQLLDESRGLLPEPAWLELRSSAWNIRGIRAWHNGNTTDALDGYAKAAEFSRQAGHVLGQAACEHNIAMVYIAVSRHAQAVEACDRSIKLRLDAGCRQRIGTTLVQRAQANSGLGKEVEARADLTEALRLHRAAGDTPSEVIALAMLAELDATTGRRHDGIQLVEEILALDRATAPESQAIMLVRCTSILEACGEHARALPLARKALQIRESVASPRLVGIALRVLGRVEGELGMDSESVAHLQRAMEVFEAAGEKLNAIRTLGTAADGHCRRGEFDRAEKSVQKALELSRGLNPAEEITEIHWIAGLCRAAQGIPDQAAASFEVAAGLARGLNLKADLVVALSGKAQALLDTGRCAEALQLVEEAALLASESGRPQIQAGVEIVRGEIAESRGRPEEALASFEAATRKFAGGRCLVDGVRAHTLVARFRDSLSRHGAEDALAAAERDADAMHDPIGRLLAAATKALLEARAGKGAQALRIIETLSSICPLARVPFRDRMRLLSDEARIRQGAGDAARARELAGEGLRRAREAGAILQAGQFERLLAELK
ncbi:MAG: adenylate/guanylate cyclase domain-containing protein [Planctomycetota bacterium]